MPIWGRKKNILKSNLKSNPFFNLQKVWFIQLTICCSFFNRCSTLKIKFTHNYCTCCVSQWNLIYNSNWWNEYSRRKWNKMCASIVISIEKTTLHLFFEHHIYPAISEYIATEQDKKNWKQYFHLSLCYFLDRLERWKKVSIVSFIDRELIQTKLVTWMFPI